MLFPVSRVMVRAPEAYQDCLEAFDAQVMPHTHFQFTDQEGTLEVLNDTHHLFRYFDATDAAEYLYDCVDVCVQQDLPEYCAVVEQTWNRLYV